MKNLIILFVMAILIFVGCPTPTPTDDSNDKKEESSTQEVSKEEKPQDVILYNGVMNDTTNLLFQKATYGFPNSIIQVKFEFSDPEVFDGTYTIATNTTTNSYTIAIIAPTFITTKNVDLTNSLYFNVHDESWETDVDYDGRDVSMKITWIRN